jgi:hypothetical protein
MGNANTTTTASPLKFDSPVGHAYVWLSHMTGIFTFTLILAILARVRRRYQLPSPCGCKSEVGAFFGDCLARYVPGRVGGKSACVHRVFLEDARSGRRRHNCPSTLQPASQPP